jgi:ABC-type nitrate/sulfonate/bicarbonate transport system ATPase subunit
MIAGLESITGGELRIGGRRVNDLPPKARGIAMVFQNYALYPHMKVYDNLAFGLKLAGTPKAELDQRVRHAAQLLEMEHLLDRYPKQLSGGQAQRVAVGRAIVKQPEVFLFDEPLSNLDAKLRAAMRVRLTELHRTLREQGQPATVVYVTHDQTEAMTMGERICVLKDGVIQQVDTPVALYQRPANAFVAGFIGSPEMNLHRRTAARGGPARREAGGAGAAAAGLSGPWPGQPTRAGHLRPAARAHRRRAAPRRRCRCQARCVRRAHGQRGLRARRSGRAAGDGPGAGRTGRHTGRSAAALPSRCTLQMAHAHLFDAQPAPPGMAPA